MCDFAADAEAARQLLVGRVLTVERVRQLNAKDYFYQMLKDNPEMLKIYPGIENELLKGASDCHIHACARFCPSVARHDSGCHRCIEGRHALAGIQRSLEYQL